MSFWNPTMKQIAILILSVMCCFGCEHFADYRYEVSNRTSHDFRVEIGFYYGMVTSHVDTVQAYSTKQVHTEETPIVLGCNEDSPQNRGFDNISRFVIAFIDTPAVQKDVKGSKLWTYGVDDRSGIYSISMDDSSFSR